MNSIKFHFTFSLCLVVFSTFAQEKNYDLSKLVDLPQTGWNKVLCMKNGNTMLFHFEPAKRIIVKVFDSTHKEIASRQDHYKVLDILSDERAVFKGLYDINGEAVLFIDQERMSKHGLIRLRYNASTGALIEEKLVAESESLNKRMRFYVMKNKEDDNYEILFCTDIRHPEKECDMFIVYFNNRHESLKEVQLEVDRKKFDYLTVLGAEEQPNGVLISISLDKTTMYGKPDESGALKNGGSIYEHYLSYYYIPKGTYTPKRNLLDVTAGVFPFYSFYTYNPFAQTINSLLYSYKPLYFRFGLNQTAGKVNSNLFFKIDENDMSSVGFSRITNNIANGFLKQHTDTSNSFDAIPIKMCTNQNGLSTLISQCDIRYGEPETKVRYDLEDFFGNIGVTQFDDDGKEIWGVVLPLSQYFKSYKHYYSVKEMAKKWQGQVIFGDDPPRVYGRQFLSVNTYCRDKNFYIVYNDYDKNFNNSINKPGDTVYTFENTNACYYKINGKKEVSKNYLFGEPDRKEYKCSFIEGADFDEQRGIYATLVQCKKGDEITLRMAWSHLN